jgi:hypothetical protein
LISPIIAYPVFTLAEVRAKLEAIKEYDLYTSQMTKGNTCITRCCGMPSMAASAHCGFKTVGRQLMRQTISIEAQARRWCFFRE